MKGARCASLAPGEHDSAAPEDTEALAERLARGLQPGDRIDLRGRLGSGKTTFVRGLARGLGLDPNLVHSPTFTRVHRYRGPVTLVHADLYRVESEMQYEELGLEAEEEASSIFVVEWGERLPPGSPAPTLRVEIEITGDLTRRLRVSAGPVTLRR
jgi:tRNA threonylcarbamoyladenosine biosynthesis protein TsaE